MDETETLLPEYSQEEYLKFAQARRLSFIAAIEKAVEDEEGLATLDPDRQSNYLKAIDAIEKQVFTQQKLKLEEANTEAQDAAIAKLIVEASRKYSIAVSQSHADINARVESIIPDPLSIPQKKLIAGEIEIGDHIENYREYRQRTGMDENLDH